ncbi:WD repeat-containing protein 63 [Geranomyces michiganensis]|nr:WD repeat-containing protein 63 [Geranomyces michiganensis]
MSDPTNPPVAPSESASADPPAETAPGGPASGSKPSTSKASRATSRANLTKSSRANLTKTASRAASKASLAGATSEARLSGKPVKSRASVRKSSIMNDSAAVEVGAAGGGEGWSSEGGGGIADEPVGPLEGTMPLFLTSATQDLFKVKGGEDLTYERPFKLIPKADLLSDLQARAAIGDFYPAKQAILDFPGEELLVHWDAEYKYGQNFFLCITTAAMDLILHPPVAEVAADAGALGDGVKKKVVSKTWESYGSEREIEADWVVNTRELLNIQVSRRRRQFGAACKFGDRDAHDGYSECKPYKDPTYEISRMELSQGVQAIPDLADGSVQTAWFRPLNFAVQYEPATMSTEEQNAIMSSADIEDFLENVTIRFEKALQQNSTLDIFQDDYQELGEADVTIEQGAHTYLQEYQSFTDLMHSKDRCISCVDWHPTIKGVLAVSCTERLGFDERVERGLFLRSRRSLILLWSFHDPIHPQLILEAPEDILCFKFNPHDPNIIAGGCITGQIVLWDISDHQDKLEISRKSGRDGSGALTDDLTAMAAGNSAPGDEEREPVTETTVVPCVAVSSIELSHRGPISDIDWLPRQMELGHNGELVEKPEHGHRELVTASADGQVAFWDTRYKKELKALDLVWRPFLRVPLSAMDNTFDYSLTKVSIRRMQSEKGPSDAATTGADGGDKGDAKAETFASKFFCATEEGDLIYADWIAEKASEEKASRVEHAINYHFGSMSDLHRSPFFPDILLSVGGWSFHIWREGVTTGPLLSAAPASAYVICGRWSPTRPGVFYISKYDGSVEVWDLLDRSHSPSSVQNISGTAISYMSIRQYPGKSLAHNQFIAAGDDEGTLHILEVPRNLTKPSKNEKAFVRGFFDREVRRLGYVKGRKEFRAKERSAFEQASLESAAAGQKKEGEPALPPPSVNGQRPPSSGAARTASGMGSMPSADDEGKLEAEYRKIEHNFLELEGLLPPVAAEV